MLKKRISDRELFKNKVIDKHWIPTSLSYAWENVITDVSSKRVADIIPLTFNNDVEHSFTITLRGTYSLGRNALLKQMYIMDENAYYLQDEQKQYIFLILPMFKTVMTGFFQEYNNPFNYIDLKGVREFKIQHFLDLVSEIYEMPELKGYNFIYDGNKFLGYTNRMMNHAYSHNRTQYFDLYILDSVTYDYLNTPLLKCYYDKFGWNKFPKLRKEFCPIDDTLLTSIQNNITTYALINKAPIDMIIELLYGELLEIRHFRNRPLII